MKNFATLCLIIFLSFVFFDAYCQEPFFYLKDGKKVSLKRIDTLVFVKFNDKLSLKDIEAFVAKKSLGSPQLIDKDNFKVNRTNILKISNAISVDSLKKAPELDYIDYILEYEDGTLQSLNNQVIVKLKEGLSKKDILNYEDELNIQKVDSAIFDKNTFILTLDKKSKMNALETSRILFETNTFEYCEPNFTKFLSPSTTDEFYSFQWSLQNIGQYDGTVGADIDILNAWNMTKGCPNIKVAVIDEGVDLTHPDLMSNLFPGYDETGLGGNGAPKDNDYHGTSVAGIIAAVENSYGIVGVAPRCKIIPVRIAYKVWSPVLLKWVWSTTDAKIASGIHHAWHDANADILNNSWGGGSPSSTITNEINAAIVSGRNNKGCIVVFAAGNSNSSVQYPASLPNVIAVGATSMCDTRKRSSSDPSECNPGVNPDPLGVSCDGEGWWGSCYGTTLDVVAPGVIIYSTDIQGDKGYNLASGIAGNYNDRFNGTSSATPHVSGVLALILSVNPNLTQLQARQVLELSTDKISGYTYSTVSGHPNGTWNNEVGYGRINAYKSLVAAGSGFISAPTTLVCSSGSGVTFTLNYPLPFTNITWSSSANLSYQSSPTSNSAIFKAASSSLAGNGWVTATINPCGDPLTLSQFPVWVGVPAIIGITGLSYSPVGGSSTYTAHLTSARANVSSYNWSLMPGVYNNYFAPNGNTCDIAWYTAGYYALSVNAQNTCGTSSTCYFPISVSSRGSLALSPNPAMDYVQVSVLRAPNTSSISGDTSIIPELKTINDQDITTTYTIKIYNTFGKVFYSAVKTGDSFTIPVSNLQDGTYIVEVSDGKNSYSRQLVVKH